MARPKVGLELSAILEVAGDLADQYGMQEVTLANLAKELNIRPPSLYNHFDGLPGLRKKLAIYGLNMLYDELAQAAIGVSGTDALLSISKEYVGFARRHPGIYEATLMAPEPEDVDVQQAGAKIVDLSVRVLQAFHLEGDLAIHAVRGLRSVLHGFSSLEQRGGFKMSLDLDDSLEIVIRALMVGLEQRGNF
ncbi:WHG domain-containing protein [Neobacillus sp. GCM10023253]|uniref:TetR/AcrR family transcriptional regulator n=1 Tax=Neobacillus sp. GCM10023253 TaxID=3252644 RepID=UPI00361260BF